MGDWTEPCIHAHTHARTHTHTHTHTAVLGYTDEVLALQYLALDLVTRGRPLRLHGQDGTEEDKDRAPHTAVERPAWNTRTCQTARFTLAQLSYCQHCLFSFVLVNIQL